MTERLASSSARVKGWLVPVSTAIFGYAISQRTIALVFLGFGAIVCFGCVDSGYMATERKYHGLYSLVAQRDHSVPYFSLDFKGNSRLGRVMLKDHFSAFVSWSVFPLYFGLFGVGAASVVAIRYSNSPILNRLFM